MKRQTWTGVLTMVAAAGIVACGGGDDQAQDPATMEGLGTPPAATEPAAADPWAAPADTTGGMMTDTAATGQPGTTAPGNPPGGGTGTPPR